MGRPAGDTLDLLIVHRPRYDDWSLPKGKVHQGEHPLLAAVREVREETGIEAVAGPRLPTVRYPVAAGPKSVDFWAMTPRHPEEPSGHDSDGEVDQAQWTPLPWARSQLTYGTDRVVLDALKTPAVVRVLLVRHGSAGDRAAWRGDDAERPLDEIGRLQAEELSRVLPVFAPTAVLSADRVRCVQTVAPLAELLGVDVELRPEFSEEGYWEAPEAAMRALRGLLATDTCTVVCSQGGAIPDLVGFLTAEAGLHFDRIRCRKGSVWALGAHDGLLATADYYRNFHPV